VHSAAELRRMFSAAGLTLAEAFGGLDGVPYRLASPRFIGLARGARF